MTDHTWDCRNCPAYGMNLDTGIEHSVNRNHGIRENTDRTSVLYEGTLSDGMLEARRVS